MNDRRPIRVRCPRGGLAPCIDDLCHGGNTTMCGLEVDFDVCPHGFVPDTCDEPECGSWEDDDMWPDDVEFGP